MELLGWFRNDTETSEVYGAPGSGKSTLISVVTIVSIFFVWWLVTELELIGALFLPPPGLVWAKFIKISCFDHYLEALFVTIGVADGLRSAATEGLLTSGFPTLGVEGRQKPWRTVEELTELLADRKKQLTYQVKCPTSQHSSQDSAITQ